MKIEADELGLGISLGHEQRGRAVSAPDVGNASAALESRVNAVERGNPARDELRHVPGPEEPVDAAETAGVVCSPRQPRSAREHFASPRLVQELRHDELEESL